MNDEDATAFPEGLDEISLTPEDAPTAPEQLSDGGLVAQSVQASLSSFSGPLPPPEMYGAYEQQAPGTAEWIREQVARGREERHAFVMRRLELEHRGNRLAAIMLLTLLVVVVLAVLALAWFLFDTGKPVYGGAATVSDVLLVVYAITRLRQPTRRSDG